MGRRHAVYFLIILLGVVLVALLSGIVTGESSQTPQVTITSPVEGGIVGEVITVRGTSSQDGDHMVYVLVNDDEQIAQGREEWVSYFYVPDVPEGDVSIQAYSLGENGSSAEVSVNVTLDRSYSPYNLQPRIYLESPTEDPVEYFEFNISGRTDDSDERVITYCTSFGYGWQILSIGRQWEKRVSIGWMDPGHYQIEIFAYDLQQTSEVVTINFTVLEYIPFKINILDPANGTRFSEDLNVSGEIVDGVGDVREVRVRVNGGEWTTAEGGRDWYYLLSTEGLEPGNFLIEVDAEVEHEGGLQPVNITVVYETPSPEGGGPCPWLFVGVVTIIAVISAIVLRARQKG